MYDLTDLFYAAFTGMMIMSAGVSLLEGDNVVAVGCVIVGIMLAWPIFV